jgi:alpha-methylacyl-CoA racemase
LLLEPAVNRSGPLTHLRILEFSGLGPAPFCAMLLAELGADVVRIDRPGGDPLADLLGRSKRSIALNLKQPADLAIARRLASSADGLIEGFRPKVMERLGLGPDELLADNPRLVYGRMTGWGQHGPLAAAAGHDLNYIAISGILHAMGRPDRPPSPPLNLVGDFGGGALYLAMGMLSALLHVQRTGEGQVIDCAMTDGAISLATMFYNLRSAGQWRDERGVNYLDGAAPYYRTYECGDGKFVAVGAIEPQFYALLLERLGLVGEPLFADQEDHDRWPQMSARLEAVFRSRTRDAWSQLLEGSDACFAPVLSLAEAPDHPHNRARGAFVDQAGNPAPAPAPRLSRTNGAVRNPPPQPDADRADILAQWLGDALTA